MGNEQMAIIMEFNNLKNRYGKEKPDVFVIVENERGEILLQKRSNTKHWELPNGVKQPDEDHRDVALKALNKEPGLHLAQLTLYRMFSREDFSSYYSDGDEIFNDMAIYISKSYFGYLKSKAVGSAELRFFSLYDLPLNFAETSKLIVDAYAADHFWIGG